jgi:hypothetical protein
LGCSSVSSLMVYASGKSLEYPAEGFTGCPAGGPAGCSFANLAGAAAGNGVDIAEEPGDGVKEPPGFVDAHWRSHLPLSLEERNFFIILPWEDDTIVSLFAINGIASCCPWRNQIDR